MEPTEYEQGFDSSETHQLLGMLALREERALGSTRRISSQLVTMGKLKCERKLRASVPDAFSKIVPEDHPFTCQSVFASLLQGEFPLLYSFEGKPVV